jgi:hypothetical protein
MNGGRAGTRTGTLSPVGSRFWRLVGENGAGL